MLAYAAVSVSFSGSLIVQIKPTGRILRGTARRAIGFGRSCDGRRINHPVLFGMTEQLAGD
jgi:hypothetical protein